MPTRGTIPSYAAADNPVSPAPIESMVILTNPSPAPFTPHTPTATLQPDLQTTATLTVPSPTQPTVLVPATTVLVVQGPKRRFGSRETSKIFPKSFSVGIIF